LALGAVLVSASVLPVVLVLAQSQGTPPPPPKTQTAPASGTVPAVPPPTAQTAPAQGALTPGAALPALGKVKAVNTTPGPQASELVDLDLEALVRGKTTIFLYFLPSEETSEEALKLTMEWAAGRKDVSVVGIVPPRGKSAPQVAARLTEMKLSLPVVWDGTYQIQKMLGTQTVPQLTLVDKTGKVNIIGASSPSHRLDPKTTFIQYAEALLAGRTMQPVMQLPRYYPVNDLIAGPYLDFALEKVNSTETLRLSDLVGKGKLTLLVFWSPDCSHCKVELPEINTYYREHKDILNIVGIAKIPDDAVRQRAVDFMKVSDLQFPTVADRQSEVFRRYKVKTTPTTVVVGPDGIVATVLFGSEVDLKAELDPRLASMKKAPASGV
jgi:peroxiredoxin